MPRSNLRKARDKKNLTQGELAQRIGATARAVMRWEAGTHHPQAYYCRKLKEILGSADGHLLDIDPVEPAQDQVSQECHTETLPHTTDTLALAPQMPPPCNVDTPHDTMDSSDHHPIISIPWSGKGFSLMDKVRRAIANAIGATLVGVNLQVILASPVEAARTTSSVVVIDPEEYLDECTANVKECWQHMKTWQLDKAKTLLNADKRILTRLATTPFPHQGLAASLAFESEIMQIMIATHELDYTARENHCAQAVRFGRLSDNLDFVIIALGWQGNTYTYCYRQPKRAIAIFNKVIKDPNGKEHMQEVSPLSRCSTYIELAVAHAQDGNETEAERCVALARMEMPDSPELDPRWRLIGIRQSELDEKEGRIHLYLPGSSHAQLALDAFKKATSEKVWSPGNRGRALTYKADAARTLGDMRTFVESLEEGMLVATQIGSKKQISEAHDVISNVPEKWQQEKAIQTLQKDIAHAIEERSPSIGIARR